MILKFSNTKIKIGVKFGDWSGNVCTELSICNLRALPWHELCVCMMPVAGLRVTQDPLRDVIRRVAMACSDDDTNCYLVDDGAIIVYADSGDDKVQIKCTVAVAVLGLVLGHRLPSPGPRLGPLLILLETVLISLWRGRSPHFLRIRRRLALKPWGLSQRSSFSSTVEPVEVFTPW